MKVFQRYLWEKMKILVTSAKLESKPAHFVR